MLMQLLNTGGIIVYASFLMALLGMIVWLILEGCARFIRTFVKSTQVEVAMSIFLIIFTCGVAMFGFIEICKVVLG